MYKKFALGLLFLFVLSFSATTFAKDGLEALHNLKGVFVNLNIENKVSPGIPRQHFDKEVLLNYSKKELAEKLSSVSGIKLFNPSDPHLKIDMIIEGKEQLKENMYNVKVNAYLKQGAQEWRKEYNVSCKLLADSQKYEFQNEIKIILERLLNDFSVNYKIANKA